MPHIIVTLRTGGTVPIEQPNSFGLKCDPPRSCDGGVAGSLVTASARYYGPKRGIFVITVLLPTPNQNPNFPFIRPNKDWESTASPHVLCEKQKKEEKLI